MMTSLLEQPDGDFLVRWIVFGEEYVGGGEGRRPVSIAITFRCSRHNGVHRLAKVGEADWLA